MQVLLLLSSIVVFSTTVTSEDKSENFPTKLYSQLFEIVGENLLKINETKGMNIELKQMDFFLYNSHNRGREMKLNPLNPFQLSTSKGKIFFLVHGWHDARRYSLWYNELTNKLLRKYNTASVIQVDWEIGSFQSIGSSVDSTESLGSNLATMINIMVSNHNVSIENIVLFGHSLGAQACGWTGKYLSRTTNQKLKRIIAFDPYGVLFSERPDSRRLNRNDAEVVHVIHTDGDYIGFLHPCGTIDFYPNGGQSQPGCSKIDLKNPLKLLMDFVWCDHIRSFDYFVEAVEDKNTFLAHQCYNKKALDQRNCHGSTVGLGDLETTREGIFYLETNSEPPYHKPSE
ncbi:hypothetical protein WA026_018311 [Henosepilachna vigintioctopunctata]|uniref:Lipase domain-containing protein n=1 Tax=Henosepilachna vigintioctopunctata TaxID=420089 RepID=A0AAW1VEM8_9CUCU